MFKLFLSVILCMGLYQNVVAGGGVLSLSEVQAMAKLHREGKCVSVSNPTNVDYGLQTVSIPWSAKKDDVKVLRVIDAMGRVLVHQLWDEDEDGTMDELLWVADFGPKASHRFKIVRNEAIAPASSVAMCVARYVPERLDDFSWENDRIIFRTYGPALQRDVTKKGAPARMSFDVFTKCVPYPVFTKFVKEGNYHVNHGEGMDAYQAGKAPGCGATRAYDATTNSWGAAAYWTSQKVVVNGPIRCRARLSYAPFKSGEAKLLNEITITLDMGSSYCRYDATFTTDRPMAYGPGLDISAANRHAGIIKRNEAEGWVTNFEPKMSKRNGRYITGLIAPGATLFKTDPDGCLYLMKQYPSGTHRVTWYGGAAWDLAGLFTEAVQWDSYTQNKAQSYLTPLVIK